MKISSPSSLQFRATALGLAILGGLVAPRALAATPDAWITTKAKIALVTQSQATASDVHVDTIDGHVTLYGKVASESQKQKAAAAVRGVEDVRDVRDLVQVVPPSVETAVSFSDERIKADVESALKEDPSLSAGTISVKSVDKGVVLLAGSAGTLAEHWSAIADASSVPGVQGVSTEIQVPKGVSPEAELSRRGAEAKGAALDAWTTAEVKLRLLADGEVPALDIAVDTHHGVVSLIGTVPSAAVKDAALADAQKVERVVAVNNGIDVRPGSVAVVAVADAVVKRNVQSAFKGVAELKHVEVDVKEGRVHLTGTVSSSWERLRAAMKARAAKGVRSVDDDLRVTPAHG